MSLSFLSFLFIYFFLQKSNCTPWEGIRLAPPLWCTPLPPWWWGLSLPLWDWSLFSLPPSPPSGERDTHVWARQLRARCFDQEWKVTGRGSGPGRRRLCCCTARMDCGRAACRWSTQSWSSAGPWRVHTRETRGFAQHRAWSSPRCSSVAPESCSRASASAAGQIYPWEGWQPQVASWWSCRGCWVWLRWGCTPTTLINWGWWLLVRASITPDSPISASTRQDRSTLGGWAHACRCWEAARFSSASNSHDAQSALPARASTLTPPVIHVQSFPKSLTWMNMRSAAERRTREGKPDSKNDADSLKNT